MGNEASKDKSHFPTPKGSMDHHQSLSNKRSRVMSEEVEERPAVEMTSIQNPSPKEKSQKISLKLRSSSMMKSISTDASTHHAAKKQGVVFLEIFALLIREAY